MKALIFPGQGCQKEGMGKDLYDNFIEARDLFERANDFLGKKITDVMFYGTEEELMQTINTQPAVFLYSYSVMPDFCRIQTTAPLYRHLCVPILFCVQINMYKH